MMNTVRSLVCLTGLLTLAVHAGGLHAQSPADRTDTNGAIDLPQVSGPVPVTTQSHPFGAALHTLQPQDLAQMGYIEEEFFISGQANVYDWPERGALEVRTADVPYTTRVLVRRPSISARPACPGTTRAGIIREAERSDVP